MRHPYVKEVLIKFGNLAMPDVVPSSEMAPLPLMLPLLGASPKEVINKKSKIFCFSAALQYLWFDVDQSIPDLIS